MLQPWVLGVFGLVGGAIALGKFVFGHKTCTGDIHWTEAFGTSHFFSRSGMLGLNIAFAVIFLAMFFLYTHAAWHEWTCLAFLTNWFLITQTIFFCLLPLATWQITDTSKEIRPQPRLITIMNVLFHIQLPLSFCVVVLYWNLVMPVGKLCIFNNDAPGCEETPSSTDLWVHLYNPLMCTSSFLVGRIPFRWSNCGWMMILGGIYIAWTVLYQALKIKGGDPIYVAVDWRSPYAALTTLTAVTILVFPGVLMLFWWIGRLRDKVNEQSDYSAQLVETA